MLLSLRDLLCGYVTVEVRGFSVERFINLAANKNLCLRELTRAEDGTARMHVSIKGFKQLRSCARKTRCKVRIIKKTGLPFLAFRHRKRKLWAIGALLFVCALYVLTSFVWVIEIEGVERMDESALRAFMSESGLEPGAWKSGVNPRELERAMLARFDDIAFLHIQLSGTRAVVHLSETIPAHEAPAPGEPRDLIAKKDGLIISIATSQGTPMVKSGDVVRAGDILVSGVLAIGEDGVEPHYSYVPAQAEVRAKVYYEMEFDVPLTYTEKSFTGNQKTVYSIILMDTLYRPYNPAIPYTHYEKMIFPARLGFGKSFPLPAVWQREEYREFVPTTVPRTVEQAELLGSELVTNRILREFDEDAIVVDKDISFMELPGVVRVYAMVTTIESIAEGVAIEVPTPELTTQEVEPSSTTD